MSHHRFVVLQRGDRDGILGELPPPSIFSKCNKELRCKICDDLISTQSLQRGMKRTKCDFCKQEKDRLINVMYYWMKKVGIKFDIEEDFEDESDDTNEFN